MRVGIIGAPSSGKSSIISSLNEKGELVFQEAATQIINAGIAEGRDIGDIVEDSDFQKRIHTLKLKQFNEYTGQRAFYDTTLVDDIAHRRATNVEIGSIIQSVRDLRYDKMLFIIHPGKVENNGIRLEDQEAAMELDRLKREALADFGYRDVIEVPVSMKKGVDAIEERVAFILKNIS